MNLIMGIVVFPRESRSYLSLTWKRIPSCKLPAALHVMKPLQLVKSPGVSGNAPNASLWLDVIIWKRSCFNLVLNASIASFTCAGLDVVRRRRTAVIRENDVFGDAFSLFRCVRHLELIGDGHVLVLCIEPAEEVCMCMALHMFPRRPELNVVGVVNGTPRALCKPQR